MKRVYQMYNFTKFVDKANTHAENNRDSEGHIPYPETDDLIRQYANERKVKESAVAHLKNSCVKNDYLREPRYSDEIFLDDGKGAKLLDSLCGIPFGLIEEILRQYSYSVTLFSGATFLALVAIFWHVIKTLLHHVLPRLF